MRGSLYDAMLHKETYATSGPRIVVRFFGGWDYPKDLFKRQNWIALAEQHGVAMGQKLPAGDAAAPAFAMWAMRDPLSGNTVDATTATLVLRYSSGSASRFYCPINAVQDTSRPLESPAA